MKKTTTRTPLSWFVSSEKIWKVCLGENMTTLLVGGVYVCMCMRINLHQTPCVFLLFLPKGKICLSSPRSKLFLKNMTTHINLKLKMMVVCVCVFTTLICPLLTFSSFPLCGKSRHQDTYEDTTGYWFWNHPQLFSTVINEKL